MVKFELDRIEETTIDAKNFKHPIPVITIKPKIIDDKSVIFLFNPGIGNSNAVIKFMNFSIYDNNYLVSYEKAGHGNNNNKPKKWINSCQKELDVVVKWIISKFPNRKIYLIGESWGSAINMLYYGKHRDIIAGTINWNCPFNIQNPEKQPGKIIFKMAVKHLATLLFNVTCTLPTVQSSQDKFTHNRVLARALSIVPAVKNNSKATLNVWKHMSKTYSWIKKHGKDPKYNFMYIQSNEDVLADMKLIDKLEKFVDDNHFKRFKTGYHVLSFEPVESQELYKTIKEFISK